MKIRAAGALVAAAAGVAMVGAPAFAGVGPVGNVTGVANVSFLSGNSVYAPVSVPVDVCGNAIAILGFAAAGCHGGAASYVDSLNTFGLIPG